MEILSKPLRTVIADRAQPFDFSSAVDTSRNVLVVAADPIHIFLSCGGLLQQLQESKMNIYVLFLTSGTRYDTDTEQRRRRVRRQKEKETLNACLYYSIRRNRIKFLRIREDKSIISQNRAKLRAEKICLRRLNRKKIGTVILPWRRDPDINLITTHFIANRSIQEAKHTPKIIEYPIRLWDSENEVDYPLEGEVHIQKLTLGDRVQNKKEALCSFTSRIQCLSEDNPMDFVLKSFNTAHFLQEEEYYFISPSNKT